jgi:hypothetical protein
MRKGLLALPLFSFLAFTRTAYAQTEIGVCPESTKDLNFNVLCAINPANAFPTLLSFILIAAIVVALLYLIWGGIKWITSGGDKANVETARSHIIAAVIGLILVFSAWFVMNFILQAFFGGSLSSGITLPGVFTTPNTPTPLPAPATIPEQTASPSAAQQPESSLPPCPTAYPPNFECQLIQ